MKTTIEIPDPLLAKVRALAGRRKTTLRALVEEGLRWLVRESARRAPYRFEDTAFRGKGVASGVEEGDWDAMRERIYEGRGG